MDKVLESEAWSDQDEQATIRSEFVYRSLSKPALLSLIVSLFGLLFFLFKAFVFLPIMGLAFGLIALSGIRNRPSELTGRLPAKIGVGLSALALVGGLAKHGYEYATEVRPGYERISFRMLKDNDRTALPYSEEAEALDGKKVFIKGYVRAGSQQRNLKDFILVGDFGACCFGGNPKITDVIGVSIQGDERVSYSWSLRKIHGTFRLKRRPAVTREKEVPRVFYQIDAEYVD